MGFMSKIGGALFGRATTQNRSEFDSAPVDIGQVEAMSGSRLESLGGNLHYNFSATQVPGPGSSASSLSQFQEYPRNVVEGWGGRAYNANAVPKGFEPLVYATQMQPVISGTSGISHGTVWLQPVAMPPTANTTMG
jgi:hypothetical protein